jgi:hypothetical protein
VGVADANPALQRIVPSPSPEEAAAIVAALERFMRATSPPSEAPGADTREPWRRAAILEGVEREWEGDVSDPWINT